MNASSEVTRTASMARCVFWSVLTVCLFAPYAWADVQLSPVTRIESQGARVLYEIDYSYDFGGRDSVYINGVGIAPAQGHFRYRT